jgi:hypothetical protein
MKIPFYARVSFRLGTPEVSVVTDPYKPEVSGFEPIDEPADLVIMSSATDRFHSDPSDIRGQPTVVNALLDVAPEGITVCGVPILAFPTSESLTFDYGRDPDANAMYLFTIGGVRVLHMGDVGNAIAPAVLEVLAAQVDVLLALTRAHALTRRWLLSSSHHHPDALLAPARPAKTEPVWLAKCSIWPLKTRRLEVMSRECIEGRMVNTLDDLRADWFRTRKTLSVHIEYLESGKKIYPIDQDPEIAAVELLRKLKEYYAQIGNWLSQLPTQA